MDASLLALTKSIFWFFFGSDFYRVRETCLLPLNVRTILVFFTSFFSRILLTSVVATVLSILFVHNLPSLSRFPYHEAWLGVFTIFT